MIYKHFRLIFRFVFNFAAIAVFFVCTSPIFAAVTVDNTSSAGTFDTITGVTTLPSFSHTVNACTNCVLYVKISTYTINFVPTARVNPATITYAGQPLTLVGTLVSPMPILPAVGNSSVEIFRLVSPPVGTGNVVVNFLVPVNYTVGAAISLNGVSQTAPDGSLTPLSGISASFTVNIPATLAGDFVLDSLSSAPVFLAAGAGQTVCTDILVETTCLRGRRFFNGSFDVGSNSRKPAAAGTTPMSWMLNSSQSFAYLGFAVRQFVLLAAETSVSGQITNGEGLPLGKVFVTLQNLNTGAEIRTQTNRKGAYRFENLETALVYQIRAISNSYSFAPDTQIFTLHEAQENVNFTGTPTNRQR